MLILCCGMVRSGSTLQYQLASELVTTTAAGKPLGWISDRQYSQLITAHENHAELLITKCHDYSSEAGDLVSDGKAKAIYVYRDIRDVVVSKLNKNGHSFRSLIQSGFVERVLKNDSRWNSTGSILCSRYEEMTMDLNREVRRIARFLGLRIEDALVRLIAEKYSLENQVGRILSFDYETKGVRGGRSLYDPSSLLHRNHIFSGKSGQWKTALTGIQTAALEYRAHEWLEDRGYPVIYNPAKRKAASILYLLARFTSNLHP